MIKLIDILKEIKVNNPNKITIGFKDDEGIWIDEDLVLQYLLPFFPNEDQNIIDWVEELNDFGASEEDLITNIKQLIQDYIDSGNRENVLDEIKVNQPTVYSENTIGWWLMQLPKPYNTQAINNFKKDQEYENNKTRKSSSLYSSLASAFAWSLSPEGSLYWKKKYSELKNKN